MNKLLILFGFAILTFAACNLENEIDLDLPEFESELVVECYLEPGKPYRLNLFKTASYYAPIGNLLNNLVTNASVKITHNGIIDTLEVSIFGNLDNFYTYGSSTLVPADYDNEFFLEVIDSAGNVITASTRIMPPVGLDSIQTEPLATGDELIILTYSQDDPNEVNFYRRMQYRTDANRTDSLKIDFVVNDELTSNGQLVLGGPPVFSRGDTMIVQSLSITEAFYDYIESRERLEAANGNPFGQPGVLLSNINGGLGIFTGFTAVQDTFYLPQ
jgi:hypothetical protein